MPAGPASPGQRLWSSVVSGSGLSVGWFPAVPARLTELVALREAVRRHAAGGGAGAEPGAQVGFGAGALALPPGQAVGGVEDLHIDDAAILVLLQDHAAPARHLRHLR